MATPQERCITDPAQLQEFDLAIKLSNLNMGDGPPNPWETTQQATPRLRLSLFRPLADPAIFAACRNPRAIGYGNRREYLDITALDKAWRRALANVPPTPHITFDLSLPRPVDGSQTSPRIYWDTPRTSPSEQHVLISSRCVLRLVASIATLTRIRVQGEVQFGLSYNGAEGVLAGVVSIVEELREPLRELAKAKRTWN